MLSLNELKLVLNYSTYFGENVKDVVVDQTLHTKLPTWSIAKFCPSETSLPSRYGLDNGINFTCPFSSLSGYIELVFHKLHAHVFFTKIALKKQLMY